MTSLVGVRASAGAGKTWRLTSGYLRLLRDGARPESILAATFTRKAAGEILARVLQRLASAAADEARRAELERDLGGAPLSSGECKALLARVVQSLDRIAIATLDSFFHRLARAFRFELDIPPDAAVSDGGDARAQRLQRAALQSVIAAAHERAALDDLLQLLTDANGGEARSRVTTELLDEIVVLYDAWREAPDPATWLALPEPTGLLDDAGLGRAIASIERLLPRLPGKLPEWAAGLCTRAQARDWETILKQGLGSKIARGEATFSKVAIPSELWDACAPVVAHARATIQARLRAEARALHAIARAFGEAYDALRRREGLILYDDVPLRLAPVLAGRDTAQIEARLGGRVEHLLLDEFQDTNPRQWAILRPLAQRIASATAGDEGRRVPSPSSSFFAVGDMKQSIYGWRGATPEIFGSLCEDVPGLSFEAMTRNWRSSPAVLAAVDRVFSGLRTSAFADRLEGAAASWDDGYTPHEAQNADLPGPVVLRTAPYASDDDPEPALRLAAETVRDLRALAPWATVGVLVRTNAAAKGVLLELDRLGVPASGEGAMAVVDEPGVDAILSALELADHPGATIASFHLSHTPLAALLRDGWEAGDPLDDAARSEISHRIRERLARDGHGAVAADWARALAPGCDARGARRLAQVVELVEAAAPEATLRPIDLVRHLDEATAEEPLPAPVRVLTVHKAKGLEFDAVVLPDLDGPFTREGKTILVDRPRPGGAVAAVYPRASKTLRDLLPGLAAAAEREEHRARTESLCVLYVAMTRARHALHAIVAPRACKTEKGRKLDELTPGRFCHASLLRQALAARPETDAGNERLHESGDPSWAAKPRRERTPPAGAATAELLRGGAAPSIAVAATPAGPRRTLRRESPSGREKGGAVRVEDLLRRSPMGARRFGLLVHAWFALVGFADDPPPTDAALLDAARRELPDGDEAWFREALVEFRATLEQPGVHEALARPDGPCVLLVEKGFAAVVDGTLLAGRFDRVLLRLGADGRPVSAEVLDYKTDQLAPERRDEVVAGYAPQMAAYTAALAAQLGLPDGAVRARLLFTRTGEAVTV